MKQCDTRDNWDNHWKEFGKAIVVNPAQAYRRRLIVRLLKKNFTPGLKILDIGSGQGDLTAELASHFPDANVYGIDLSQEGIEIACQKVPLAHFFKLDLLSIKENIPLVLEREIDFAICSEVLEHLDEPSLLLQNTMKFLKKGAVLVVTVPSGPRSAFDCHIGHRQHFCADDIRKLLIDAGYHVEYVFKSGFPFFNLYKLLVILRGKQLIIDNKQPKLSRFARLVMTCFFWLFKANLTKSPWGWQLVAIARV